MGVEEVLSTPRSLWQRAYLERVIASILRECLDHGIVFDEGLAAPNPRCLFRLLATPGSAARNRTRRDHLRWLDSTTATSGERLDVAKVRARFGPLLKSLSDLYSTYVPSVLRISLTRANNFPNRCEMRTCIVCIRCPYGIFVRHSYVHGSRSHPSKQAQGFRDGEQA